MESLTRGQLALRVGVNLETLRFYEKEGLLAPASRTSSGYRQFAESAIDRLEFVRRAKGLGFSLTEIRELLVRRHGCNDTSAHGAREFDGGESDTTGCAENQHRLARPQLRAVP